MRAAGEATYRPCEPTVYTYLNTNYYYYIYVFTNGGYNVLTQSGLQTVPSSSLTAAPNTFYLNATTVTPYSYSFTAPTSAGSNPGITFNNWPINGFAKFSTFCFGPMTYTLTILLPTANSITTGNGIVQWNFVGMLSLNVNSVFIQCQESQFFNVYNSSGTAITTNTLQLSPGQTLNLTAYPTGSAPAFMNNTASGWPLFNGAAW